MRGPQPPAPAPGTKRPSGRSQSRATSPQSQGCELGGGATATVGGGHPACAETSPCSPPPTPKLPQLPLTPRCLLRKEVVGEEKKKKHPQQECELRMDEVNWWGKPRDFPLGVGTLEQDEISCRKLKAYLSHLDKFWLHHIFNYNHMQWEYEDCTLPTFEQGWKYKPTSNVVPFLQDPKTACTNPVVVKFKACTGIIWKACLNMD